MRRLVPKVLAILLIGVVLGAAAFVVHPRPLLQRALAALLGQDVTIEAAEINFGAAAVVTLFGFQVPGARPGSSADLLRIATLTVALDLAPLLAGEIPHHGGAGRF